MLALLIGSQEWLLIILALGLLFGATRIPTLMRGVGQGIKEFKTAIKEDDVPANAPPAPPTGGPSVNPTTSDETPS